MSDPVRNPKFDNRIVYVLDTAELRPGDILLTRYVEGSDAKGRLQSVAIRRGSGGQFDHVLVCSQPPTFVEAVGVGVKTVTVARFFAHDPSNVRILRYPDTNVAAQAAARAQLDVGRTYSTRSALASVFPGKGAREIAERGIFCSALVAKVYSLAGAPEFQARPPHKTTPATIERLNGLVDVTAGVLRPILAPSNIEQMSALDGDKFASPSERQTEISQRWGQMLGPRAEAIVQAFPEIGLHPGPTHFGLITFVMDALDAESKVPEARRADYREQVIALDSQLAALAGSGELEAVMAEFVALDAAENQRVLEESFKPNPDIDVPSLRNYLQTSEGQLAKRRKAIAEFETWGLHRSLALAAHVAAQGPVLAAYEAQIALLREVLHRVGFR